MLEAQRPETDQQVEQLKFLIVSSLENSEISEELWAFSPLPRDPRLGFVLGPMAEIEVIYRSFEPEIQNKFREGIVRAIAEWEQDEHKPEALADLIYLAGYTRAFKAAPHLVALVDKIDPRPDQEESRQILTTSISALAHFAKNGDDAMREGIVEHLRRWFYVSGYERYAGILMNGICACDPEDYPNYFLRCLEVASEHPNYFELDAGVRELIRVVTPQKIREQIGRLPDEARKLVQERID